VCCSALQCVAVWAGSAFLLRFRYVVVCFSVLQCIAVCCSVSWVCLSTALQVCCSVLQCVAVWAGSACLLRFRYVVLCCSVLQCVAVCCRVSWVCLSTTLQVCCSVLQCVVVCCSDCNTNTKYMPFYYASGMYMCAHVCDLTWDMFIHVTWLINMLHNSFKYVICVRMCVT